MFRAAVRISANALPFRMGLAQALFDMEMYDEAVMEAREIAHIHPDAKIHFLLGKALMRLGRNNEALMALTLAHDNSKNAATIKELIDSISNEVEEDIGVPDPFAE
nr:hypothetical protein HK105_003370 [Polyrhizophydium stewartii]